MNVDTLTYGLGKHIGGEIKPVIAALTARSTDYLCA
jgi:hypothetical protein